MPGIPLMNYDTRECKQVMMVVTSSGDGDMMVTQTPASPLPLSAI